MSSFYSRFLAAGAVASFACAPVFAENITPDLQFNGYATAGAAWTNNAHGASYLRDQTAGSNGISSDPTMDYDSVVGLQFNYKANDRTNLVTQLVANEAAGNFTVKANWAYIGYQLSDDVTVRAGRMAFPTYLYSENLHVGEAYPWARLPSEIYGSLGGLYSFNGVEVLYRKPLGDWNLTVQPVAGSEALTGYQVNNLRGGNVNLANDNLTLHIGTMLASVDVPAYALSGDRASYSDIGATYDDGQWFAAGELAELRFKGIPQDFNSGYLSVGHYFGDFLPYLLYSRFKAVNNDETVLVSAPEAQTTVAAGVRYQLRPNTSLKAQVDRIGNFQGSNGMFSFAPGVTPSPLSSAYLYSLSLNVAF